MRHDTCEAVLLIGFGGPTQPEEIRPFLANVLRGRTFPPGRIEEVVRHYEVIGGKSPYNKLTFLQADALRKLLQQEGPPMPVYVGMRNWHPLLAEVLLQIVQDGVKSALGFILAPHQGQASWGRSRSAVQEAQSRVQSELGMDAPRVHYCEPWFNHPSFVEAVSERLNSTLLQIPKERRDQLKVLFTAHSVPVAQAGSYVEQLMETCTAVAESIGLSTWELVYQSRSGSPHEPWLGPDVGDAIVRFSQEGLKDVLLAPIGFICDHVEVLYDLDVQAREIARDRGIGFFRAGTVNDHPSFIRMMADVVRRGMTEVG